MNPNHHGRKDPTLSDLEAFENLLRESLDQTPVAVQPAAPDKVPMSKADHDAMAELARLVEPPLEFSLPEFPDPHAAAAPVANAPVANAQTVSAPVAGAFEPYAPGMTASLPAAPAPGRPPSTQPARPVVAPQQRSETEDSLAAFEEELRRFDASRLGMTSKAPPDAPHDAYYSEPAASDYPPQDGHRQEPAFSADPSLAPSHDARGYAAPVGSYATPTFAEAQPYPAPQPSPLEAMEQRLAAEAAAASYMQEEEAPQGRDLRRSRGVFLALGGIALVGLAVLGGVFSFGSARKVTPSGEIPLIAAKKEPAKEKPADPGGVEIPNQNAQVLAGRDVIKDTGPAKQVVNTTEQPMDLKEVTRRESVRIVSSSPLQPGSGTPAMEASQLGTIKPEVEARRVTSVRVPLSGEATPAAPGGAGAPHTAAPPRSEGERIALPDAGGANTPAERPVAAKPDTAKLDTRPTRKTDPVQADAAKTQAGKAGKQQATKANTPVAGQTAASATPAVRPPERITPERNSPEKPAAEKARSEKAKRSANAPMSLTGNSSGGAAAPVKTAAGTFAVQLASRPTEADARAAATALGTKYSAALGGKPARVTSGDANGQKVFRVRAGGYSKESAVETCESIRASGGACFVIKQ